MRRRHNVEVTDQAYVPAIGWSTVEPAGMHFDLTDLRLFLLVADTATNETGLATPGPST